MDAAPSRSSRGLDEEDDDDEEFGRREGYSSRKDLTIKIDGMGSGTDQRPNTPRSKHSATEQRRRSKINDRFQILRELIPHSDQKRDKASFLLEVIEYIRFLEEKVQKYESSYPEWNQGCSKLMPWVKFYFRSFWKNARNNSQVPGDGFADPSQVMKNGSTPSAHLFSRSSIPVIPTVFTSAHNTTETDVAAGVAYKAMETATAFANNIVSQDQSQWLRSSGLGDCSVSSEVMSEQELTIDQGTISMSAAYSQGLLSTLTEALQSSGVDLSQASISVQIILGKRAINMRPSATATTSIPADAEDPASTNQAVWHSRVGSNREEASQASKRHKVDKS